jgi:hypothetical protein
MSPVSGVSVQAQVAVAMQAKANGQVRANGQAAVKLIEAAAPGAPPQGPAGTRLDVKA